MELKEDRIKILQENKVKRRSNSNYKIKIQVYIILSYHNHFNLTQSE
jgi:hypothetical protein